MIGLIWRRAEEGQTTVEFVVSPQDRLLLVFLTISLFLLQLRGLERNIANDILVWRPFTRVPLIR